MSGWFEISSLCMLNVCTCIYVCTRVYVHVWLCARAPACARACVYARACSLFLPRSGELRTQKLKSHLVRTQSLNILSLKPGVGKYIAIHATLIARDFFLA